jgi:acetylornithine deacetylase/succinyl-diaminopimelate desuccinylase-like protein
VGGIDWSALGDETVEPLFRTLGLHGYGFSPFLLDDGEFRCIHGTDERISLDNLRAGVRSYTEMLLAVAAA